MKTIDATTKCNGNIRANMELEGFSGMAHWNGNDTQEVELDDEKKLNILGLFKFEQKTIEEVKVLALQLAAKGFDVHGFELHAGDMWLLFRAMKDGSWQLDDGGDCRGSDGTTQEEEAMFTFAEGFAKELNEQKFLQRKIPTWEQMKCLWEAREEYARLSKLMDEYKIRGEEEAIYWRFRTIEKLVLYGDVEA